MINIFETCDIDTDALDYRLCAALSTIPMNGEPGFSTTGTGMLVLMHLLDTYKIIWNMENLQDGRGVEALCLRHIKYLGHVDSVRARTPQLALALAAAEALGITVPRKTQEQR